MNNTNIHSMSEFNPRKDLNLIEEMIMSTRKEIHENGAMFMLWGWLVFIASLLHFTFLKLGYPYPHIAWILMPVGAVISVFVMRKASRQVRVKTWVDKMLSYIWISFGVCLTIVLIFGAKLQINAYPMVLMVYGMGTFLSGGALNFKPLIYGGISCWILATVAFFVTFQQQLLLLALAILLSYIVPGHLLRKKFHNV